MGTACHIVFCFFSDLCLGEEKKSECSGTGHAPTYNHACGIHAQTEKHSELQFSREMYFKRQELFMIIINTLQYQIALN